MRVQQFPHPHFMKMPVTNAAEARIALAAWVLTLGHGFHPDTAGADYVTGKRRTFSEAQAKTYDASIRQCRDVLGDDVYKIALKIYTAILGDDDDNTILDEGISDNQ